MTKGSGDSVILDFEDDNGNMLARALHQNDLFARAVLAHMKVQDGRFETLEQDVKDTKAAVNVMVGQQMHLTLTEHNQRLDTLEADRQKRQGLRDALDWAPKVLTYLMILIGAMIILKSKGI
jgi:hypothetical protein